MNRRRTRGNHVIYREGSEYRDTGHQRADCSRVCGVPLSSRGRIPGGGSGGTGGAAGECGQQFICGGVIPGRLKVQGLGEGLLGC